MLFIRTRATVFRIIVLCAFLQASNCFAVIEDQTMAYPPPLR